MTFQPSQFVAHRGLAELYPENTLTAITAAINAGATNIEVDVQFSKDGIPFLYHDDNLLRLSGIDQSIFDLNAKELTSLSCHYPDRFGDQFIDVPISLVEEFAHLVAVKSHVHFFVELKEGSVNHFGSDHCLHSLYQYLQAVLSQCTIISDHFPSVIAAKEHFSFPSTGIVFRDWEARNDLIKQTSADFAFINLKRIPEHEPITANCPVCIYEITDLDVAAETLNRGAHRVESFNIKKLITGLC